MTQSADNLLWSQSEFFRLLTEDVPLLDVRAPAEFRHGSLPAAYNMPLLDDAERDLVGRAYRQQGSDAAMALGYRLVSGNIRQSRLELWLGFFQQHPDGGLFCFRGGQRSRIAQQWLAEAGVTVPRIQGGYKALRRFLIQQLEHYPLHHRLLILGGKTGSGKTRLLQQFENSIDLEALAVHRGSAFGRRVAPQPAQSDFENGMAIALMRRAAAGYPWLLLEDESRAVGSVSIPLPFHQSMRQAPLAVLEEPVDYRARVILDDYIRVNYAELRLHDPLDYRELFRRYLTDSLDRISRRLGAELHASVRNLMHDALQTHLLSDDLSAHTIWIRTLLHKYYDPMYEYQINNKLERLVFRGSGDEFLAWAAHFSHRQTPVSP